MAQAILTGTNGIVARDVQLTVGDTAIPAYDARPEEAGRTKESADAGTRA